jgi:hypothetical protein
MSVMDAYEVLEDGDFECIMDGEDDTEFFEMDIEESIRFDPDEDHSDMWHDFDQINPDDYPDGLMGEFEE